MPNNKCIIGLAGKAGAGKDTVATMLEYMFKRKTKATFAEWHRMELTKSHNNDNTIHFADNLKRVCALIFGIPYQYFQDREYKDNLLYSLNDRIFMGEKQITNDYREITIDYLNSRTLEEAKYILESNNYKPVIRLRTILQYIGTDVCRKMIDKNVWVDSAMIDAHNIADSNNYSIIADVRFETEADAIMGSSLYGGLILIERDGLIGSNHSSEKIEFNCPLIIDNNGTKMQLFYKVYDIFIKEILPLYKQKV